MMIFLDGFDDPINPDMISRFVYYPPDEDDDQYTVSLIPIEHGAIFSRKSFKSEIGAKLYIRELVHHINSKQQQHMVLDAIGKPVEPEKVEPPIHYFSILEVMSCVAVCGIDEGKVSEIFKEMETVVKERHEYQETANANAGQS